MKIRPDTIARTAVLAVALINQAMAVTGRAPLDIDESALYQLATLAFTLAASAAAWWRNNSFSKAAIEADGHLERIRSEVK
jgi:SPP1 family holin